MTAVPYAYVAGPLFDEGERWWIETIEEHDLSDHFVMELIRWL